MAQNFGHEHPLILLDEGDDLQGQSNPSKEEEKEAYCSRCGEEVLLSAPRYSCVECPWFYLHKVCAEAPSEIDHPFHCNHPLLLLQNNPYPSGFWTCDFCDKIGDRFVYHCSCGLDFHIKCALFSFNIAQRNLKELQHVTHEDPSPTINSTGLENLGKCFGCWEPLADSVYFSLDCGFNLHKKCVEIPLKINHMCHRKHPLLLQFNGNVLSCNICQDTRRGGLVYCCLTCEFALHIQCVSPPLAIIEDKSHPHPFTLLWRRAPFTCDACATQGNGVAYFCCECNLIVHRKCISLPHCIKSRFHEHRIFHTYFIEEENFKNWDCIICLEEINTELGCYYCSVCKIVAHVNCATKYEKWYYVVEGGGNEDDDNLELSPITVIETNDGGEATEIEHFKHEHNLMLTSAEMVEYDDKRCDGCILPVSPPCFYCTECDFFLHKKCAESPMKKQVLLHNCQELLTLIADYVFRCGICGYLSNGFGYKCDGCKEHVCLRCVSSFTQRPVWCHGHPHRLLFYLEYEGQCHSCGEDIIGWWAYYCKDCKFALCYECLTALPSKVGHKWEKHLLPLTYHDDNDYSATHYCDICEEPRDPSHWFYHCSATDTFAHLKCDTSAHLKCALGDDPFIRLGSIYKLDEGGLFIINTLSYLSSSIITGLNALNVVSPVKIWLSNVHSLSAAILPIGDVLNHGICDSVLTKLSNEHYLIYY